MRKVVILVMLAGALCADRAIAARPQIAEMARGLATRLATGFRRVVAAASIQTTRRVGDAVRSAHPRPESAQIAPLALSPFQFRLPPPLA